MTAAKGGAESPNRRPRRGARRAADGLDPLLLDLLEWVARETHTYAELMEAWRSACPRLTVWEDAVDRGLVTRRLTRGEGARIELTPLGRVALMQSGRLKKPNGAPRQGVRRSES
ncbi:MAG: hypothetical protein AB1586_09740 [Pseudomonadota bacterium]